MIFKLHRRKDERGCHQWPIENCTSDYGEMRTKEHTAHAHRLSCSAVSAISDLAMHSKSLWQRFGTDKVEQHNAESVSSNSLNNYGTRTHLHTASRIICPPRPPITTESNTQTHNQTHQASLSAPSARANPTRPESKLSENNRKNDERGPVRFSVRLAA